MIHFLLGCFGLFSGAKNVNSTPFNNHPILFSFPFKMVPFQVDIRWFSYLGPPEVLARLCIAWIVRPDAHTWPSTGEVSVNFALQQRNIGLAENGGGEKRKKRFQSWKASCFLGSMLYIFLGVYYCKCTTTCRRVRRPVLRFQLQWQIKTFQDLRLCSFSFLLRWYTLDSKPSFISKNQFKQILNSSA